MSDKLAAVQKFLAALAAAGALAVATAASAQVQGKPAEDAGAKKLEKIEVKSDADGERRESTAAKTVVTREEIVKYGDTTVLEAMKRLPGVTVVGNSIASTLLSRK